MEQTEHQEVVRALCSPHYLWQNVDPRVVHYCLNAVVNKTNDLDFVKKAIFYDKKMLFQPDVRLLDTQFDHSTIDADLFHSIVGIATEAGELCDRLITMGTRSITAEDKVNIVEEVGDLFWYVNLLLLYLGTSLSHVLDVNAAKLYQRYPGKFTKAAANERNLDAEQEVLAGATEK